jgi:hypothetical protein
MRYVDGVALLLLALVTASCAGARAPHAPAPPPPSKTAHEAAQRPATLHPSSRPTLPRLAHHSACELSGGRVRCWKLHSSGNEVGDDLDVDPSPADVYDIADVAKVRDLVVSSSGDRGCALDEAGTVSCWEIPFDVDAPATLRPSARWNFPGATRLFGDEFASHLCALLAQGRVACWGRSSDNPSASSSVMRGGGALVGAVELGVGRAHACARLDDGSVVCWGDNSAAQLGVGYRRGTRDALLVEGLPPAVQVLAAEDHACALAKDGSARCWGQLFPDAFAGGDRSSWVARPLRYGCDVRALATGGFGSPMVLRKNGDLYSFNLDSAPNGGWTFALRMTGVQEATSNGTTVCARLLEGVKCWEEDRFQSAPGRRSSEASVDDLPRCPGDFDTKPPVPAFGFERIATARAFVFNRTKDMCEQPFAAAPNGTLRGCASLEGTGAVLSAAQRGELLALLSDRKSFEGPDVRCFDPHHAFVFYDVAGNPTSWLSVCFECRKLAASAPIPAAIMGGSSFPGALSDEALGRLEVLVDALGLPRAAPPVRP